MKTLVIVLFALLLFVGSAVAGKRPTKRCPPKCAHRTCQAATQPQAQPAVAATRSTLWDDIVTGFELNAGFRWEHGPDCTAPTAALSATPPVTLKDPFYIGTGVRLPLTPKVGAFGNFDRDWTDAPHWQARLGIYVNPWRR